MDKTIAIIGVGNMGAGMAGRLLDGGWAVQACDLVADKVQALVRHGARAAATPAEAAAGAQALIVCVVDARQSDSVLFGEHGAASALAPGSAVLLCPTIAPHDAQQLASRLADQGLEPIEAPMSGGPARARDGSMSLMVACADAVFERHRALLERLAGRLFRVGTRWGDGARTKLVNNLLAGINLAGAAEAMALAERLGLDLSRTLDVIEQSSGQSWIGSDRMRRVVAGLLGPLAHEAFNRAAAAGDADLDDAALLRLFRQS